MTTSSSSPVGMAANIWAAIGFAMSKTRCAIIWTGFEAGLRAAFTTQMPAVNQRCQDAVIGQDGEGSHNRPARHPRQKAIARHLRPKHPKRGHAGQNLTLVRDIKPARGLIGLDAPTVPRRRVQVVKPDRQAVFARIARIMADLF